MDLTIAFGILFTQSPAPVPQPKGVLLAVTSPHSAGVFVIATFMDCALLEIEDCLDIMVLTYHRHFSDSFGVEFENIHGDEELMFGGA